MSNLHYFGTDGIRDHVDGDMLRPAFIQRLGHAIATTLEQHRNSDDPPSVVLGRDTRESSPRIANTLIPVLVEAGITVRDLGVIPSPGVSMAVLEQHAHLGIAITASHNPSEYNGIKLVNAKGMKLHEGEEAEIEELISNGGKEQKESTVDRKLAESNKESLFQDMPFAEHYIRNWCRWIGKSSLQGIRMVLDTANGAASHTSQPILEHAGVEVIPIGNQPSGKNINHSCGSENLDALKKAVLAHQADMGAAHDGDADRLALVDEAGFAVPGEQLLGALGHHFLAEGRLKNHTIVTTVQSNQGLDIAMERAGGKVYRTSVGDRHVLNKLLETDSHYGGETSGHLLFLDQFPTGDGLLTLLQTLSMLRAHQKPVSQVCSAIPLLPAIQDKLTVSEKIPLENMPQLRAVIEQKNASFGTHRHHSGRILVRYSGTEPALRFLVEATTEHAATSILQELKEAAKSDLKLPT